MAGEPRPGLVISNGLRAGLLGLANRLAREMAGDGITFIAPLPGNTSTGRIVELGLDNAYMGAILPAGRLGKPAKFAALATFLASGQASCITGQANTVDGGGIHSN